MKFWDDQGDNVVKLFITHNSALEFYRNARLNYNLDLIEHNPLNNSLNLQPSRCHPGQESFTRKDIYLDDVPFTGDGPLELATNIDNPNYHMKNVTLHYQKGRYPNNSFLKYNNEIYIASPELVFLQMAKKFNEIELLMFGLEICGSYALSDANPDGFIFNLPAITTKSRILNYLRNFKSNNNNFPGICKASKISQYIIDGSASPQESKVIIKLCCQRKLGGYGVKNLKANYRISLSDGAINILGRNTIRPDLCCPKTKIAIEYQSRQFHNNLEQFEIDKIRTAALNVDGWKTFSFVPSQMRNVLAFHQIAISILQENLQDPRIRTQNFEKRRRDLWMQLSKL